jgi:hypothetical protein
MVPSRKHAKKSIPASLFRSLYPSRVAVLGRETILHVVQKRVRDAPLALGTTVAHAHVPAHRKKRKKNDATTTTTPPKEAQSK